MSIYSVLALSSISGCGTQAARVVLALYALELGAQPLTVGLLAATFSAFPMLIVVPAGRLADRFGSRWLLFATAAAGALGMLLPYFSPTLPAIFAAAALSGLSGGINLVLLQNVVGIMSTPDNRSVNFSNFSLSRSVANLLAPLIAGFSIDHSGHAMASLYLALLMAVPVVMLAGWKGSLRGPARQVTHATSSIRAMLSVPSVRRVLTTSSLLNMGTELYHFYMPVYTHAIGLPASTIGIILAMNSAAGFFVRLVMPRLIARFGEERLLAYAFYVGAACLTLIPFFKGAVLLMMISFVFGLGMGCTQPIITILMFGSSPEGRSGEALGVRMTVIHFTKLVGPVAFGGIGSAVGLLPVFWICAAMLGAGGILSQPKKGR